MTPETTPAIPKPRAQSPRFVHGLGAADIVLRHESQLEWKRFHRDICKSLEPIGAMERALASRVAECLWRLRRVVLHERRLTDDDFGRETAAAWRRRRNPVVMAELRALDIGTIDDEALGPAIMPDDRDLPETSGIELITRYEAHISRQMHNALHELEAMQQRRNGASAPLARISVHGLPGT